jgi:integrase
MHSCGVRTGETRALQAGHIDVDAGHIDVVRSNGNRSRRLPVTTQVAGVLAACDRASRAHFPARATFFVSATGNQVTAATVGTVFARIWDRAGLARPAGGQQPRPYDFRHYADAWRPVPLPRLRKRTWSPARRPVLGGMLAVGIRSARP